MALSRTELVKKISDAFADASYPGDDRVAYDQSGRHLECDQVARHFRGKHWQSLSVQYLRQQPEAMFFFSPEGLAFFLPAYLLASVNDYKRADSIPLGVIVSLSPSLSKTPMGDFKKGIDGLSTAQRQAIASFLEYLKDTHGGDFPLGEPQTALDEFWARYLP